MEHLFFTFISWLALSIPYGFGIWKTLAVVYKWNYYDRWALYFDVGAIVAMILCHIIDYFAWGIMWRILTVPMYFKIVAGYIVFWAICTLLSFHQAHRRRRGTRKTKGTLGGGRPLKPL